MCGVRSRVRHATASIRVWRQFEDFDLNARFWRSSSSSSSSISCHALSQVGGWCACVCVRACVCVCVCVCVCFSPVRVCVEATGIAATGFDGAMLDFEGDYTKLWPTLRAQVTVGVCALKSALTKALPGAVLYWSVDTGNYFDYSEMIDKQCVDMFLVLGKIFRVFQDHIPLRSMLELMFKTSMNQEMRLWSSTI